MALTAPIGAAFGSVGGPLNEFGRAMSHGAVGGFLSSRNGGDFGNAFISSSLSSLTGSVFHNSSVGLKVGSYGVVGGFSSKISGG